MRHVRFVPPAHDTAWKTWAERAERERRAICALYEACESTGLGDKFKPKIRQGTYKGIRQFVLPAFHKHCAYCETALEPGMGKGDVEHYRPKLEVKAYQYSVSEGEPAFDSRIAKYSDLPAAGHGGYFWLAYEIENLLPACTMCNRYEKGNFFPVAGKRRLRFPEHRDDEVETRMLLNPYIDDPNEHLAFDDSKGFVRPLSLRGAVSIEVFGLNREGLPEARHREIHRAVLSFNAWWSALAEEDSEEVIKEKEAVLERYERGVEPYSAAALTHIGAREERLAARGQALTRRRGIWPSTLRSRF